MDYSKGAKKAPGKFMDSGKGLGSYPDGTMTNAKRVSRECGPGLGSPKNRDQEHANRLLQQAYKTKESLRGMNGM